MAALIHVLRVDLARHAGHVKDGSDGPGGQVSFQHSMQSTMPACALACIPCAGLQLVPPCCPACPSDGDDPCPLELLAPLHEFIEEVKASLAHVEASPGEPCSAVCDLGLAAHAPPWLCAWVAA